MVVSTFSSISSDLIVVDSGRFLTSAASILLLVLSSDFFCTFTGLAVWSKSELVGVPLLLVSTVTRNVAIGFVAINLRSGRDFAACMIGDGVVAYA